MRTWMKLLAPLLLASVSAGALSIGCGNADEPYKAAPVWSGKKASIPAVPQLPTNPIKSGDAYTIYGARHHLQSRIHDKEVTAKEITLVGYIVEENVSDAPVCAIHKTGKADPEGCVAEIPSFWIADAKGETKVKVRVLGWAKNYASVYEAMEKYKNLKEPPKELFKDEVWSVDVPYPLPAVGAKVKVTGKYGYTFSKASTGIVSDPSNGVLTYGKIEVLEPAAEPLSFKKKK
ncbi:MAG TPA: hypothetical protein PLR99_14795 [Polyangiaceae bacterium]|nr:hypothetical protein [Polyangiaceae bacterium]